MTIELMKGLCELRAELVKQIEAIDCLMNARIVTKDFTEPYPATAVATYSGEWKNPNGHVVPDEEDKTAVYWSPPFIAGNAFLVWDWDPLKRTWITQP